MANPSKTKSAAKGKKAAQAKAKGQPVCIAALFCDTAVVGADNSITIARTVDTFTFPQGSQPELGDFVELTGQGRLVVMMKRDTAVGRHEMPVTCISPDGKVDRIGQIVHNFSEADAPHMGYNYIGAVRFVWRGAGGYWLEVKTQDGKVVTRTPLVLKLPPRQDTK